MTTAPLSWADALFTAVSSVTVTGLAVVDVGSHFTRAGQLVILLLIQLGGLGLMTFATLVIMLLGRSFPLRHRIILREDLNQTSLGDLGRLVRVILVVVLGIEGAGAILLALRWVPDYGWSEGLFLALFHAVSAFNNAGVALWPDSMVRWAGDPLVNLVIPLLIIVGGLGFTVLFDLWSQRRWRRLALHTKLMLAGTAILIPGAFLGFLLLEWTNPGTLGGLHGVGERIMAAWFQAVTTRTAGFNTVDIGALRDSTSLMVISLMLIGGGSTSTAGGIKVTTFLLLLLATLAFLRRQPVPQAFGRSIAMQEVVKVLAITAISLLVVLTGIFLLTLTHEEPFLDLAFEIASAFSTTGLSRGTTARLDGFGYLVVGLVMFIGRIGPLGLAFLLAAPTPARIRHPEGRLFTG
ncbi:Ktr system potassium transporter B (plasmid) [Azospirillum thermophilum]|uniref:Ktr system potassium transporter B n=2 Tax=Azospirillum thermophilum TaxID=2202148 RepID=A0A2S2CXM7_9PROT|nr:Ktr system potassium transporter B [Azospirillum thermophilum]